MKADFSPLIGKSVFIILNDIMLLIKFKRMAFFEKSTFTTTKKDKIQLSF